MSFKSAAKAVTISVFVLFCLVVGSTEVRADDDDAAIEELTARAETADANALELRAEAREAEKDAEKYEKTMNVNTFSVADLNLYKAQAQSCRANVVALIALAQEEEKAAQADRNQIKVMQVCSTDNYRFLEKKPENIDAQLKAQTNGDENNAKLRNRHAKECALLENAFNEKNNDWNKKITDRGAREARVARRNGSH